MAHPETFKRPRYTALLLISDSNTFFSKSARGLFALARYTEISYTKLQSGKIRFNIFLKDPQHQRQVSDIMHAHDMKGFEFKNPYKSKSKKD